MRPGRLNTIKLETMITILKKQTKEPISFFVGNLREVGSDGIGTFITYVPYYSHSFTVKEHITEDYKEFLSRLEERCKESKRRHIETMERIYGKTSKKESKPQGFFNDCLLFRGDKQSRIAGAICWTMIAGNIAIGLFMIIYSCTR